MPRRRRPEEELADQLLGAGAELTPAGEALLELFSQPATRPKGKKRSWSRNLSPAQQRRYVGAGKSGALTGTPITGTDAEIRAKVRAYYNRGGNLSGGRGYHPPKNAAPRKATVRSSIGRATNKDLNDLKNWRKNKAPDWIPRNNEVMSNDTAAILSQIGTPPKNWKSVRIEPDYKNNVFIMTVTTKRGATRVVVLPDINAVSEVTSLLASREGDGRSNKEIADLAKQWNDRNGDPFHIDVTVVSYGTSATNLVPPQSPKNKQGKALPTRRRK